MIVVFGIAIIVEFCDQIEQRRSMKRMIEIRKQYFGNKS